LDVSGGAKDDGWTNFSYDTTTFDSCLYLCPDILLNIHADRASSTGLATSTNRGVTFSPGDTLFVLNLHVPNDRNLGCRFLPLRWNWSDCNSNTLLSPLADTTYQSRRVFDYIGTDFLNPDGEFRNEITGKDDSLPGAGGMPLACDSVDQLPTMTTIRFADFKSGGVKTICCNDIDLPGDLNQNCLAFEAADLQLYIDYFTQGDSVFRGHFLFSESVSEVNGDGRTLTVSDMVYMIRVIRGDAIRIPLLTHERDTVTLTQRGDEIVTDMALGALHLVFEGETTVELRELNLEHNHGQEHEHGKDHNHRHDPLHGRDHAHGKGDNHGHGHEPGGGHGHNSGDNGPHGSPMTLEIGIVDGNTHVLIYDIGDNLLQAGAILDNIQTKLLHADASDFNGSFVVVRFDFATDVTGDNEALLPTSFALRQNYPNPFNPTTIISFSLPKRSDVELTIYNMLGQTIRTLLSQSMPAGEYSVTWDGKDKSGSSVASGVYLYRLRVGAEFSETRKMVLLK